MRERIGIYLRHLGLATACVLAAARPCRAIDGVIEINQPKIEASGGFPFTITQEGSYRLTGNLNSPNQNFAMIRINTDNVTLDLNGFAILGTTVCTGTPVTSCSNTGLGGGVVAPGRRNIVVLNGTVRGMGLVGVSTGRDCRIERVHAAHNGTVGIFTGDECVVIGNTASANGDTGIAAGANSSVSGNTAHDNGNDGIAAGSGSTVRNNSTRHNGGDGIDASSGCVVAGNTAYDNNGDGIEASSESTAIDNTARNNNGYGLRLGTASAYADNVLGDNNTAAVGDPQVAGGIAIGLSICRAPDHFGETCP